MSYGRPILTGVDRLRARTAIGNADPSAPPSRPRRRYIVSTEVVHVVAGRLDSIVDERHETAHAACSGARDLMGNEDAHRTLGHPRDVVEGAQQQIDVGLEREVGRETARAFTQARVRLWIAQARDDRLGQTLHRWRISRQRDARCGPASATHRCRRRRMPPPAVDGARLRGRPAPAAPARDSGARGDRSARTAPRVAPRPTHPVNSTRRRASRQISDASDSHSRAAGPSPANVKCSGRPSAATTCGSDCISSRPPFSSSMRPTNSRRQGRLSSTGADATETHTAPRNARGRIRT